MSFNSILYLSSIATNLLTILFKLMHLYSDYSDTLQMVMFVCPIVSELRCYGCIHQNLVFLERKLFEETILLLN